MINEEMIRNDLEKTLRSRGRIDPNAFKQYGVSGIKVYFKLGAELSTAQDFDAMKYSRWFDYLVMFGPDPQMVARGVLDACMRRTAQMAAFLEGAFHWGHTVSLAALLISEIGTMDDSDKGTALWVIAHEARDCKNPDVLQSIADLILSGLLQPGKKLQEDAFECSLCLSLPESVPALSNLLGKATEEDHPSRSHWEMLLTVLFHSLLWPGPVWETEVWRAKKAVRGVGTLLSKLPLSSAVSVLLQKALEGKSEATIDSTWACCQLGKEPDKGGSNIMHWALREEYRILHEWVDREFRNDRLDFTLKWLIERAILAPGTDKGRRVAMAKCLANMECYLLRLCPGGIPLQTGTATPDEISKLLSYFFLTSKRDVAAPRSGLVGAAGFPVSRSGMYAVNKMIQLFRKTDRSGDSREVDVLMKTREEIAAKLGS